MHRIAEEFDLYAGRHGARRDIGHIERDEIHRHTPDNGSLVPRDRPCPRLPSARIRPVRISQCDGNERRRPFNPESGSVTNALPLVNAPDL